MTQNPHAGHDDKFPKVALGLVAIAMFTNAFSLTVLFPFIGAMVQQLGLTDDPRELGFYAGYIGAAFMVGRLTTSYFWGLYSDRYGRRPVMLVGMAGMVLFGVGFGLSFNFAWAIAMRVLTGVFNGIVGTGKTMVSELCSEAHQARGMSVVTATWGLGLVIGPAIGGLLAFPADTMPALFPTGGVWSNFPFFLPMLLSSIVAAVGLVPAALYLPETLPEDVLQKHAHEWGSPRFIQSLLCCCLDRSRGGLLEEQEEGGDEGGDENGLQMTAVAPLIKKSAENGNGPCADEASSSSLQAHCTAAEEGLDTGAEDGAHAAGPKDTGLLRNPTVMLAVCMYAVWSMGNIMMNEVLPIWGLAPRGVGGLDITTAEIGGIMAGIGVFLVLFQTFAYHRIAACFAGPVYVFRATAVVWIGAVLFMPTAAQVEGKWGRILATAAFNCLRNALGTAAFTSIFMMINNSSPSHQRGSVNGLSMVVGSIGKAVGPAVGANLFAWSITSGLPFPLDYGFTFYFTAVVGAVSLGMSFWLPHALNFKFENGLGAMQAGGDGTKLLDAAEASELDDGDLQVPEEELDDGDLQVPEEEELDGSSAGEDAADATPLHDSVGSCLSDNSEGSGPHGLSEQLVESGEQPAADV